MRRYETVFIIRPNAGEEEINRVINYVSEIITADGGTIIETNRWGLKKLAYLIKKESMGYYVLCDFASVPASVAEIERRYRIDDAVIKFMTLKIADDINAEGALQAVDAVNDRVTSEEAARQEAEDDDDDDDDVDDDDVDDDDDDDESKEKNNR
ncbi:MAG: 30S ribosomal protein S6 [Desulforhopalus sp.]|nr:30S ribosomal protein S6 [Desulforhopalus sp.]